jgi:hypothetical protein
MRGRRDVTDVQRLDVGGMGENVAELAGEQIDLVVVEFEAGQPGDVHDIGAGDSFGHGQRIRGRPRDTATGYRVPLVSRHRFLSPEWIVAVAAIRDEYRDRAGSTEISIRANVSVTETPFGHGTIEGHIDTTGGALTLEVGHLDDSDFALEMRYAVAHQIFVDRDPQAMVGILISGQVKLTGDSSKILALAGMAAPPGPESDTASLAREVMARIDAITE